MVQCLNGVYRVDGSLAVSRAIGNCDIKSYIIAEPEVTHHELTEDDDLLILTSDGLMRVYKEE
jgi:protein phosphatase 1L